MIDTKLDIVQPDVNGEFPTPADGAIWMLVTHGIPQTPLNGKAPFLPGWNKPENLLTTPEAIRAAAAKYEGCNFGSAFNGDYFAFEADAPRENVPTVRKRFEQINGQFTSPLVILSSADNGFNRGHRYYRWIDGIENVAQSAEATKHGDFSIRAFGEQCVSPGSVHPRTREQYRVMSTGVLAPPSREEIAFWNSERIDARPKTGTEQNERRLLKHGQMHGAYISEAGRLWNRGYEAEDVVEMTVKYMLANSEDPVDVEKVRKEAESVTKLYPRGSAPESFNLAMSSQQPSQSAPVEITAELLEKEFPAYDGEEPKELPMLINGFMPEGVIFFGSLAGTIKTWAGVSIAKALTTGAPLWGVFGIPEKVAVLYLIPEASDNSFKRRLKKMGSSQDKTLFRFRTISQGMTKSLIDPMTLAMVKELSRERKVLIIVDTAVRFLRAENENSSMENSLMHDSEMLRAIGAETGNSVSILFQHHSPKALKDAADMTLENVLRGTGDFGAMADCVYGFRRDENLYSYGEGPEEVEVVCVKPRDFKPPLPFRLALSRRPRKGEGDEPISLIDTTGDLAYLGNAGLKDANAAKLVAMLKDNPAISFNDLTKELRMKRQAVRDLAHSRGWHQVQRNVLNSDGSLKMKDGKPKTEWVWVSSILQMPTPPAPNAPGTEGVQQPAAAPVSLEEVIEAF